MLNLIQAFIPRECANQSTETSSHCKRKSTVNLRENWPSLFPGPLLDGDRLGKVAREVDVETLQDGEPVGNQLEGDDVQETLENVDRLGDLDLQSLAGLELVVARVADDNGLAITSND